MTATDSRASRQGLPTGSSASRGLVAVEVAAVALMIGAGIAAWMVGIFTRGYDYDEVLRAHSIWLTTQGLRPYSDFFEVHPPYFVLLTPLLRAFPDPVDTLRALRLSAALGHLAFLGGLITLAIRSLPRDTERRWAWLGVAVVAFNPYLLDFLVEFRVDGWGHAFIVGSILLYVGQPAGMTRSFTFGVLTGMTSALLSPKMVLLPPLIVLMDGILKFSSRRGFFRAGAAYGLGVAVAAILFLSYLAANGISLERIILLLGRYHAVSNRHAGFRYGLLGQIVALRPQLLLSVAGLASWSVGRLRSGKWTSPYEPAVALWLVSQMLLVTYPYKQYYAPWFLFASGFTASLGPILATVLGRAKICVFICACVVTIHGAAQIASFWAATGVAQAENDLIRWMNQVARPEDRVVGSPPYHPIRRYDTFFLSFNTTDPGGFDSERIFGELPALRPFINADHYRAELEAHPPAFVVLRSPVFEVKYPVIQRTILEDYLRRQGYRTVRVGVVWFAVRPDRFEFARLNGLLKS